MLCYIDMYNIMLTQIVCLFFLVNVPDQIESDDYQYSQYAINPILIIIEGVMICVYIYIYIHMYTHMLLIN